MIIQRSKKKDKQKKRCCARYAKDAFRDRGFGLSVDDRGGGDKV